jgi:hypothetical protein
MMWSERKKRKGGRRLNPGMRTRKYMDKETIRSAGDEKGAGTPTTVRLHCVAALPNSEGLSQSQIPMLAMRER